jgi:GrpB-like predicted nucleotidyltransferase (UPF0157 family)
LDVNNQIRSDKLENVKALWDQPFLTILEHVGSTSVPGLSAKPVIDMIVAGSDSADESSYISPLKKQGFILRIRESEWFEHRVLNADKVHG